MRGFTSTANTKRSMIFKKCEWLLKNYKGPKCSFPEILTELFAPVDKIVWLYSEHLCIHIFRIYEIVAEWYKFLLKYFIYSEQFQPIFPFIQDVPVHSGYSRSFRLRLCCESSCLVVKELTGWNTSEEQITKIENFIKTEETTPRNFVTISIVTREINKENTTKQWLCLSFVPHFKQTSGFPGGREKGRVVMLDKFNPFYRLYLNGLA